MTHDRGIRILYVLFVLNIIIISWQEIKQSASPIGWPRPSRFVGLSIAFTLLAVFGEIASAELAAVIGAGLTLGLIMKTINTPVRTGVNPPEPTQTGITGIQQV